MIDITSAPLTGPQGPKPRKSFSRRNIFLYGTLITIALFYALPLYVMFITSLKGMPEIRLGNVFSPPLEVTFQPWVKAWSEACTGLTCNGLSTGFWNSVQITIPSVVLSIIIASVNGYALSNWKFKGADAFFTILILTGYTMSQAVRERIPELAVLKCLGFTDRTILSLVLAESFLLCFIGALIGLLLASVVTGLLPPEYPIKADARVWLFALATTVFLALVVGLPPALRAMHLKIVDALAGR